MAICTTDGQRFAVGDTKAEFCVQSCSKPINYCLAIEERGEEKVHQHVGREPSGVRFNELALNHEGKPHNPMINAGAIMTCSLIQPEMDMSDVSILYTKLKMFMFIFIFKFYFDSFILFHFLFYFVFIRDSHMLLRNG